MFSVCVALAKWILLVLFVADRPLSRPPVISQLLLSMLLGNSLLVSAGGTHDLLLTYRIWQRRWDVIP